MNISFQSIHIALIKHLRKWHRRLGIIAALFLIYLSITGIALNHTHDLEFDSEKVNSPSLLNYYGIKAPNDIRFFADNNIVVTDNMVWFNHQLLLESHSGIIGACKFQHFILIVSENELNIFDLTGGFVDRIEAASGLPNNIKRFSVSEATFIVEAENGYFQTDSNFIGWQNVQTLIEPTWVKATQGKEDEITAASLQYRAQLLTWERVVQDAHSGRILGFAGVLLIDMIGIILLLLSVSGIYIWIRYNRAKR